jgi:hypothetical protein
MWTSALESLSDMTDPLDSVERAAIELNADYERHDDDELRLVVQGSACDVQVFVTWRPEIDMLLFCASFDLKIADSRVNDVARLIMLINERLLLGSFDLWSETGMLLHRLTVPLAGNAYFSPLQALQVLESTREACERFYPAFNYVLWAGKSPQEALEAVLFETAGEA